MEARPDFPVAMFEMERQRDPEGFRSEFEALFVPAGDSYLAADRIAAAVTRTHELQPGEVDDPFAAVDLGFVSRRDRARRSSGVTGRTRSGCGSRSRVPGCPSLARSDSSRPWTRSPVSATSTA